VPVGQAASFTDRATGDPSIVIRPRSATFVAFVAFDAVCPHAGCTVGYDPSAKVIICPCHGSQFNASTGAVEVGPVPTGLTKLGDRRGTERAAIRDLNRPYRRCGASAAMAGSTMEAAPVMAGSRWVPGLRPCAPAR
jgi:nitrite reductase/ring-hydroxylating ferredoxin subunit